MRVNFFWKILAIQCVREQNSGVLCFHDLESRTILEEHASNARPIWCVSYTDARLRRIHPRAAAYHFFKGGNDP